MDGHGDRNTPKEAQNNREMLLALLSHSEELRKGNAVPMCSWFVCLFVSKTVSMLSCEVSLSLSLCAGLRGV